MKDAAKAAARRANAVCRDRHCGTAVIYRHTAQRHATVRVLNLHQLRKFRIRLVAQLQFQERLSQPSGMV
ncbi:hypothetical protein Q3C01_09155 [Bradyrhizobium sp. UFLA05-109]